MLGAIQIEVLVELSGVVAEALEHLIFKRRLEAFVDVLLDLIELGGGLLVGGDDQIKLRLLVLLINLGGVEHHDLL